MSIVDLPTPPTDNLYKFMAISGLLIIVFGLFYPFLLSNEQLAKTEELYAQLASIVEQKSQRTMIRMEQLAAAAHNREQLADVAKRQLESYLTKEETDLAGQERSIELQLKFVDFQSERLRRIGLVCYCGIGLGLALSIAGFVLWYCRVQKYQDSMLLSQAGDFGRADGEKVPNKNPPKEVPSDSDLDTRPSDPE